MNDLNKAREWVGRWEDGAEENDPFIIPEEKAAINVIKSLPDKWVDAKKVQEIIDEMNRPWGIPRVTDLEHGIEIATEAWRRRLEALLTPKLPTLADMTEEERQACVGMWCDNLVSTAEEPALVVLSCVQGEFCWIVHTNLHGERSGFTLDGVRPRFDLLRAWNPDGTPVEAPMLPEGMRLADHEKYGRMVVSPRMDSDDEYKVSRPDPGDTYGIVWQYIPQSELTFLDGE